MRLVVLVLPGHLLARLGFFVLELLVHIELTRLLDGEPARQLVDILDLFGRLLVERLRSPRLLLDDLPRGLGGDALRRPLLLQHLDARVALRGPVDPPLELVGVLQLAAAEAGSLLGLVVLSYLLVTLVVALYAFYLLLDGAEPLDAAGALPDALGRHLVEYDSLSAPLAAERLVAPLAVAVAVHEELGLRVAVF